MKKHTLTAHPRQIIGRKVIELRREGQIPATIYGKNVKSVSVVVEATAFGKVYKQAGETGLVELGLDQETRPVLIHSVQTHPVSTQILHVEFHQVDLKEKVKANVPIELTGQSPAAVEKVGVLLTILDEVEVEALPTDLPEKIELPVTKLAVVDQEVKVKDLKVPPGVTILTDPDQTLVKVGALVSKEAEAETAAEEVAKAEAAAAAAQEAPEGAGPPPTEETKETPGPPAAESQKEEKSD